jgi:hypothetical protein
MEPSDETLFQEFLAKNKRNINCLLDKERNIRLKALKEFDKDLLKQENNSVLSKFWTDYLLKPLVLIYDDKIEKLRELSISITTKLIERFDLKDEAQVIIPGIWARMNKTPFPEASEEVRIQFLELLELWLEKDAYQFVPQLPEVCNMLSKILLDNNPEMKNKAASFWVKLWEKLSDKVGPRMKKMVISLTENLGHQHSKVRKSSLNALRIVIGCKGAEEFLEEALPQLKMTINDRHHDVRRIVIRVIDYWLQKMDINATKKFEKDLILFLLNGASDDIEEIRDESVQILERHGNDMRDALIRLGEEDDGEQNEENKDVEMESS